MTAGNQTKAAEPEDDIERVEPRDERSLMEKVFGEYGLVLGVFLVICVFAIFQNPEGAGRSIGGFFGAISKSYHDAADPRPAPCETKAP